MWTNLHLGQWRQPRPVQVQLFLQGVWGEEESARQRGREADIQDPSRRRIQIRLDVEDENILDRHWKHRRHALQEVTQQWWQEVLLGHVLEADSDTAAQHVLSDDEDTENALCWNAVGAIWKVKEENEWKKVRWMNRDAHLWIEDGLTEGAGEGARDREDWKGDTKVWTSEGIRSQR